MASPARGDPVPPSAPARPPPATPTIGHGLQTSPSPSPPPSPPAETPLPLSASIVLSALPAPTSNALVAASEAAYADVPPRVTVRLVPVGSAPALRQRVFKVAREKSFGSVVAFVGRRLGIGGSVGAAGSGAAAGAASSAGAGAGAGVGLGSVFCYVNSVFAPGLDEVVGNLWRCFKTGDELVVAYHVQPAFG